MALRGSGLKGGGWGPLSRLPQGSLVSGFLFSLWTQGREQHQVLRWMGANVGRAGERGFCSEEHRCVVG